MGEPRGFSWAVAGKIACMANPLSLRKALEYLKDEGIGLIITLTERPLRRSFLDEFGFDSRHIPMRDFSAPTQLQIGEFVRAVDEALARGTKVAVHCQEGLGRTGTMLACWLVRNGRSADEAIAEIRRMRPGSVETREQEEAVREYERRRK